MEIKTFTSTIALIFLITESSVVAMEGSDQESFFQIAKQQPDLGKKEDKSVLSSNSSLIPSTQQGETKLTPPPSNKWTWAQFLTFGWYGGTPSSSVIPLKEEKNENTKTETSQPWIKVTADSTPPLTRTPVQVPVAQLDIDESAGLSNGWKLVKGSTKQDIEKSIVLKKSAEGIEILGENYTIYTDIGSLEGLDQGTFLFNVELRGTKPGTYIQYWDGGEPVNSIFYNGNGKNEWETLSIEFKVDAQHARFHRLYAAIRGATKGSDTPSVIIRNVKLWQK